MDEDNRTRAADALEHPGVFEVYAKTIETWQGKTYLYKVIHVGETLSDYYVTQGYKRIKKKE